MVNGVGGECHVRVYDQTDFTRFLGSLPKVDWKVLPRLRHVVGEKPARRAVKAEAIAEQITGHLKGFDGQSISVRKLKAELKLGDAPGKTFKRARELALQGLPEWSLIGGMLQRVASESRFLYGTNDPLRSPFQVHAFRAAPAPLVVGARVHLAPSILFASMQSDVRRIFLGVAASR